MRALSVGITVYGENPAALNKVKKMRNIGKLLLHYLALMILLLVYHFLVGMQLLGLQDALLGLAGYLVGFYLVLVLVDMSLHKMLGLK